MPSLSVLTPTQQALLGSVVIGLSLLVLARFGARWVFGRDSLPARLAWRLAVVCSVALFAGALLWDLGLDMPRLLREAGTAPLFQISDIQITAATIGVFFVLLASTWYASVFTREGVGRALRSRKIGDPGTQAAVARLLQYAVGGLGLAVSLDAIGIDLGALVTAGAVFAVGIGFAMQNIAQNFVSGVILLAERTIKPGDVLEVEGRMVRVRVLGIRSTIATTLDDEEVIIPNSFLVQSNVKNFTLNDDSLRVRLMVGVAYESDLDVVLRALHDAAKNMPSRSPVKDPVVALQAFGSSSVDFEVSVWTNDPWGRQRVRSDLALAVWFALKKAGVTIAFPQLDVHFDMPIAPVPQAPGAAQA